MPWFIASMLFALAVIVGLCALSCYKRLRYHEGRWIKPHSQGSYQMGFVGVLVAACLGVLSLLTGIGILPISKDNTSLFLSMGVMLLCFGLAHLLSYGSDVRRLTKAKIQRPI